MKIVQFKDSNNNDIFPVAYNQGGCKLELLWTNPSPTTSFAPQTISLDLSEYDYIFVQIDGSGGTLRANHIIQKNGIFHSLSQPYYVTTNTLRLRGRNASALNSGITFGAGYNAVLGGTIQENNEYGVPCSIYGIKTSYIVPTDVQGLQYVEV